jgi:hypothetical protein
MSSITTKPAAATGHRRRNGLLRDSIPYVVTALLVLLFCGYVFDLRHQDLRVPMGLPWGDYLSHATIVKGVMQHGWYTTIPMVGAPHGLDFHDYPMAEGLHFIFFQIAGILRMPVMLTINLYYILGYVLIALTSLYVFRALRLPLAPAIAACLLFAFMPHHWMRGESHLMLSSYYMIPLTVLVILWLAGGEEFVRRLPQDPWFRYRLTRRGAAAAVICALTGSAGIYYAVFGMVFLAIMALFRFARCPRLGQALNGLMPIAFIGSFLILNLSPSIVYWMRHGANNAVAARDPSEADVYGMKIVQLLLPIIDHRIPLLAHWKSTYLSVTNSHVPNGDLTVTLGIVAGFGFLCLVAWLFFGQDDHTWGSQLLTQLSVLNMSAVLIATIGGFGSLFAFVVSPQIRAYHRVSIYIAFFSLLAVLILIRRMELWWFRSENRARLLHFAAAAVMFAGLWDITPTGLAAPREVLASVESDRNFIRSIEADVPRGSMIYQLPYHPFPEYGDSNKMLDYDPFRGYLYSDHLRWSYGAMRGRPADEWQKQVASLPVSQMLITLAEAGFQGIYIDRNGYADGADELIGRFGVLLAVSPVRSADQRFVFFPMMRYAAGLKRDSGIGWESTHEEILQLPIAVSWKGCTSEAGKDFWCPYDAELQFENDGAKTRSIHLQATFQSATGAAASLTFGAPISRTIDIAAGGQPFSVNLAVPPGHLRVKLHSDATRLIVAADPRVLVFAILNLDITGANQLADVIHSQPAVTGSPALNLHPIDLAFIGCTPASGGKNFWCPFDGALELTNSGSEPRYIRIAAKFQTAANGPALLTMGALLAKTLPISQTAVPFAADLILPPGKHTITLHCDGKRYAAPTDPRVLVFSILDLDVSDR